MRNISLRQKNVVWLTIEKILKVGFSFLATVVIARKLGVTNFGALNYFFGLTLVVSTLANLGLDSLLVKEIVKQNGSIRKLILNSIILKASGLLIGFFSLFLFFRSTGLDPIEKSLLIPFGFVLLLSSFQILEFYFLAIVKSKFSVSAYFWGSIISSSLKILCLTLGFDIVAIAYLFLLESIISGSLLLYYFLRNTEPDTKELREGTMNELLKSSMPLVLAGVSVMIYMKIDQIMLRNFLGLQEVGEYTAAIKISEAIYFLPIILVGSYFSKWIEQSDKGEDFFISVNKIFSLLVITSIFYTAFIWAFGDLVISLLYGPKYINTPEILKLHSLCTLFVFIGVISSKILILKNLENLIFYISLLGAVLNIVLNLYLIPRFGGQGAAWATVLSYMGSGYLFLFVFKDSRDLGIHFTKALLPWNLIKNLKSY